MSAQLPNKPHDAAQIARAREIVLPWPSADLSPNSRVHWSRKARAAKKARADARIIAIAANWDLAQWPDGELHLWITFHAPTRRLPDDDNMLARFKPQRDGIADALKIDDRRFVSHPYVSDQPRKGGEVRVRITGGPTP
jgi:hypothetical protein